jgi:hypothetical protein
MLQLVTLFAMLGLNLAFIAAEIHSRGFEVYLVSRAQGAGSSKLSKRGKPSLQKPSFGSNQHRVVVRKEHARRFIQGLFRNPPFDYEKICTRRLIS